MKDDMDPVGSISNLLVAPIDVSHRRAQAPQNLVHGHDQDFVEITSVPALSQTQIIIGGNPSAGERILNDAIRELRMAADRAIDELEAQYLHSLVTKFEQLQQRKR